MTDFLWAEGIEISDVTGGGRTRCYLPSYAIRPALAKVYHVAGGFQNFIGKPGDHTEYSSHFSIHRDTGLLLANVPLNYVAKTNGGLAKPSWRLAPEVPSHYSQRQKQRIRDANRPTITSETGGFSRPAWKYRNDHQAWLDLPADPYSTYGEPGTLDWYGKPCIDFDEDTIASMVRCGQATFDLGLIRDDPSEDTIDGHCHLNSVDRPDDPGAWWLRKWRPHIIQQIRGAPQGKLQPTAHVPDLEPITTPADEQNDLERKVAALQAAALATESRISQVETWAQAHKHEVESTAGPALVS